MGLKKKIRDLFWVRFFTSELHCIESRLMPKILSDEQAIKRDYRKQTGHELNLENPHSFSEKNNWYKLKFRMPLMQQCADKVAVREYVSKQGYAECLNEVYGVYGDVDQIKIDQLPNQFVLKASHGSHMNIIVKNKDAINWKKARLMMRSWLHQDIAWSGREWVYKDIPRRIIAEKYLEDETGELRDYKFYCFNGEPKFMQLEVGRFTKDNTRNFYDLDWNLLPFGKELPHNPNIIVQKPQKYEEMISIARDLCNPFQYVRVDLYQVSGKIYFGELTFFPAGGAADFIPKIYDQIVGEMWELKK